MRIIKDLKVNKAISIVRLVIFVSPFLVSIWLIGQYFSIFGNLSIKYDFKGESPFISEFRPRGRVDDREQNQRTGETYQKVVGDPAYVDVEVPRSFDTVDVTLEYNNPDQPLVELGVITTTEPFNIQLHPFENKTIDQALAQWDVDVMEEDGTTLLQREKKFSSVSDFVNNYPQDQRIGIYRYDLLGEFILDSYEPNDQELIIDRLLRGRHEFFTYAKDEDLFIEFDITDINREFNEDPVKIEVYRQNVLIHEELLPDDGIIDASGELVDSRQLTVNLPNVEEGLYKLIVAVNDDIVVSKIRTQQHKFVVNKRTFIINNEEYLSIFPNLDTSKTELFFQGDKLNIRSDHPGGLQKLLIDQETLDINKVHEPFYWEENQLTPEKQIRNLMIPNNDVLIITPGFFSFTKDSFFDINYGLQQLDETTNLEEFDYLIYRDYESPAEETKFYSQTTEISLDGVAGDRKELTFALSAPGIDRYGNTIKLHKIKLDFHRAPLYERIINRLKGNE